MRHLATSRDISHLRERSAHLAWKIIRTRPQHEAHTRANTQKQLSLSPKNDPLSGKNASFTVQHYWQPIPYGPITRHLAPTSRMRNDLRSSQPHAPICNMCPGSFDFHALLHAHDLQAKLCASRVLLMGHPQGSAQLTS